MQPRERRRVQIDCSAAKGDLAVQQFKDRCDINNIVKKFRKTGLLDQKIRQGTYQNLAELGNLFDMQMKVTHAENTFAALPAAVRAKFHNKVSELVEFAQDEKNYDSLVEMGLAAPRFGQEQSSQAGSIPPAEGTTEAGEGTQDA